MLTARDRLIVALDIPTASQARSVITGLGDAALTYKVGKQLFTAEGPQFVRELVATGRKVFLDSKFHDIPNTVAGAVRSAASLGVSLLTVHAAGGRKMLQAAVQAAGEAENRPAILAVTVLTSLSDEDLQQTGITGGVKDQVLRLAALARNAGCDGIVASAQEARDIRRELGTGFLLVTPGVRPAGEDKGDQKRVVTPGDAIRAGADYLVVGRPVTEAKNPSDAAEAIVTEIEGAMRECRLVEA